MALLRSANEMGLHVTLVCPRDVDRGIFSPGARVLPIVTEGSFKNLHGNGEAFYADICHLDQLLELSGDDSIVVLTAHLNELKGVNRFLTERQEGPVPRFFVLVHQIFPPEADFVSAASDGRKKFWLSALAVTLSSLDCRVMLCSTPSDKLRDVLATHFIGEVNEVPLPFDPIADHPDSEPPRGLAREITLTGALLGDGRYEKGMHLLLCVIQAGISRVRFKVQEAKLRGYPAGEAERVSARLRNLAASHELELVPAHLFRNEFCAQLESSDFLILPYHPLSYDARVSGLLVQAFLLGKPAVVSSDTWLSDEMNKYGCGCTFRYEIGNPSATVAALASAIDDMRDNYPSYRKAGATASHAYRTIHNSNTFLQFIYSQ
jgi:hypothetical protein